MGKVSELAALLKIQEDFSIPCPEGPELNRIRTRIHHARNATGVKCKTTYRDGKLLVRFNQPEKLTIDSSFVLVLKNGQPANPEILQRLGPDMIREKIESGQLTKSVALAQELGRDDRAYLK